MSAGYVPTPGPLPGEQYEPSNGTEGEAFISSWCGNCERDKVCNGTVDQDDAGDDDMCQILGASFRGEAVEWREVDGKVKCISFVEKGQPIPPARDTATVDMFGGVEGSAP